MSAWRYVFGWVALIVGCGAYQTGAANWGWFGGVVSVVLALGLPFIAYDFWMKVSLDQKRKREEIREEERRQAYQADYQQNQNQYQKIYLQLLSSMMAKMMQADGHIDAEELRASVRIFSELGFTTSQMQICMDAFSEALSKPFAGPYSAMHYAKEMVSRGIGMELRQITYEILWDIACADRKLACSEKKLLQELVSVLGLPPNSFEFYYNQRIRRNSQNGQQGNSPPAPQDDSLAAAYELLGCSHQSTDEELRQAYRALAKKLHPDALRAQGIPEALMAKANERMARINVAWEKIKQARKIGA